MDAVGADDDVGLRALAVREFNLDRVATISEAGKLVAEHARAPPAALRRASTKGRSDATVKNIGALAGVALTGVNIKVLPSCQRRCRHATGATASASSRSAKSEVIEQHAYGIRRQHQAGADLAQLDRHLFVDVNVEAGSRNSDSAAASPPMPPPITAIEIVLVDMLQTRPQWRVRF